MLGETRLRAWRLALRVPPPPRLDWPITSPGQHSTVEGALGLLLVTGGCGTELGGWDRELVHPDGGGTGVWVDRGDFRGQ